MRSQTDTVTSTLAKTLDGIKELQGKNAAYPDSSDDSLTRISSDIARLSSEIDIIKQILESNHGPKESPQETHEQQAEPTKLTRSSLAF